MRDSGTPLCLGWRFLRLGGLICTLVRAADVEAGIRVAVGGTVPLKFPAFWPMLEMQTSLSA